MTLQLRADPVLSDAADVRALSGLSGAQVVLMTRDGRHWFVRKAAREPAGSARLRLQLAKQQQFQQLGAGVARVANILGDGEVDGRFYFDMEFVRGTDGVSYLRRATYAEIKSLASRLCAYLDLVAAQCAPASGSLFEAMYAKLCDVQRRTNGIGEATLAQLFIGLEKLRGVSSAIVPTACHGDMTLENLVIDERGDIWLLDFLDAPFEHWWQDVAKLHQDLDGGWYQLTHPPIARCVLDYVSQRLVSAASTRDPGYPSVHALMLALTFVRILPYARTADERAFVKLRVEHFARLSSDEMRTP